MRKRILARNTEAVAASVSAAFRRIVELEGGHAARSVRIGALERRVAALEARSPLRQWCGSSFADPIPPDSTARPEGSTGSLATIKSDPPQPHGFGCMCGPCRLRLPVGGE